MGAMNAMGMSEAVDDGMVELRQALSWHLSANHYPPVPLEIVDACVQAIHYAEEGEPDAMIRLPEGTLWRGQQSAPTWALVDGLHLESFIGLETDWGF